MGTLTQNGWRLLYGGEDAVETDDAIDSTSVTMGDGDTRSSTDATTTKNGEVI